MRSSMSLIFCCASANAAGHSVLVTYFSSFSRAPASNGSVLLSTSYLASSHAPRHQSGLLLELTDPTAGRRDHGVASEAADGAAQSLEIRPDIAHLIAFGGSLLRLELPQAFVDRRDCLRAGRPPAQSLQGADAARLDEIVHVGGLVFARLFSLLRLFGLGFLPLFLLGCILKRCDRLVRIGDVRGIREEMLERPQLWNAVGVFGVVPRHRVVELRHNHRTWLQAPDAAVGFRRVRRIRIEGPEVPERGDVRIRPQVGPPLLAPLRLGLRLGRGGLLVDLRRAGRIGVKSKNREPSRQQRTTRKTSYHRCQLLGPFAERHQPTDRMAGPPPPRSTLYDRPQRL